MKLTSSFSLKKTMILLRTSFGLPGVNSLIKVLLAKALFRKSFHFTGCEALNKS